jgi:hypothetical protein
VSTQYALDPFESETIVAGTFKRWSSSAVECYLRKADCNGCYYQTFFAGRAYGCKMNLAVEQLLQSLGSPSNALLARHA